jgi:transcriptional regulator with XRE-family HTH domain
MEDEANLELKIGRKVRALRNEKGFSQEYVAFNLNISPKTYSNMENNKSSISINTLEKLAKLYDKNILDILLDDKVLMQHKTLSDTSSMQGIVHCTNSEELVTQLKERIQDLKSELSNKEKRIENLEKLLHER